MAFDVDTVRVSGFLSLAFDPPKQVDAMRWPEVRVAASRRIRSLLHASVYGSDTR